MSQEIKEGNGERKYNPALDRFEKIDLFPNKTEFVKKKFEGRNIRKEIQDIKDKERNMKL